MLQYFLILQFSTTIFQLRHLSGQVHAQRQALLPWRHGTRLPGPLCQGQGVAEAAGGAAIPVRQQRGQVGGEPDERGRGVQPGGRKYFFN